MRASGMKYYIIGILFYSQHIALSQPLANKENISTFYQIQNVQIKGETNINSFYFTFENPLTNYHQPKYLIKETRSRDIIEFLIPVNAFKGSNALMESDFQNLLKAEKHPMVKVGIERKKLNAIMNGSDSSSIGFYLTIAGVTKYIKGNYLINLCNKDEIIMQGNTQVKLTDFSIEPPKKMLGVLQVKDVIFIKFDLLISNLNLQALEI